MQLVSHEACGDVVPAKSFPKLSPQNLVAISKSDGVVHPPGIGRPMKLLGSVQSLLILCAVQESKLGLDDTEPVIRLWGLDASMNIGGFVAKKSV
jgi:hypothetical protein